MNDREERYEGQEEGEYHFSDDQLNYEMETEPSSSPLAAPLTQNPLFSRITTRHKIIMGVVVFIILMSVIIKIMVPTAPPTDFAQTTMPKSPLPPTKETGVGPAVPVVATASPAVLKSVQGPSPLASSESTSSQASSIATSPAVFAAGSNNPSSPAMLNQAPPASITRTTSVVPTVSDRRPSAPPHASALLANSNNSSPPAVVIIDNPVVPSSTPSNMPQNALAGSLPSNSSQNVADRVASVEQQNAAIVNLLQTEYAQKISSYEAQSAAMRSKVEELTKRLNRIENSINQLTQLLQGQNKPPADMISGPPSGAAGGQARSAAPHIGFTVQAIIPGRAWLKSDAGETITVAEGDVLRDYGRITKIDPYDGIVNIDTGNRIVALSYGMAE